MAWFVMIPPAYKNASDSEKELVDFRVEYTDPKAVAAVEAGQVINGSNYGNNGNPQIGQDLIRWKGPFATEDQAKAAQAPRQQSANPLNDAVNAAQNATDFLGFARNVWAAVSSGKMWRSLAWIVLGVILMLIGISWWIGPSAERQSPLGAAGSVLRRLR